MNIMQRSLGFMLLGAVLAPAAHAANLVSNGGFETGDFTDWATAPAGSGSAFYVSNNASHTGSWAAGFQATDGQHDAILQNLATSAGTWYTITLWVLNYGAGEDSLRIRWEGGTVLDMTPVGTGLENWEEVSVNVLATMDGSSFEIGAFDANASTWVDDVSVEAVPEPATMTILGLGALALLRRRPKR